MSAAAATVFSAMLVGLALFQAALALGAPLGAYAWGGQHRRLPPGLRIGSVVAVCIYAAIIIIALRRTGLIDWPSNGEWTEPAAWVVVAYLSLGVPLNAISRSRPERLVMTPIVALLLALALAVALAPSPPS
ncbi:MAG TPA: hypothetical protein VLZ53_03420 [Devosia sp.]|nr:hypothetical protein [Devosia sp.]